MKDSYFPTTREYAAQYGLDLNSNFEDSPGIKDISLIDQFFNLDL